MPLQGRASFLEWHGLDLPGISLTARRVPGRTAAGKISAQLR